MSDADGFKSDADTLNIIKSQLNSGAQALDAVSGAPHAVDAGMSSQAVGAMLSRLIGLSSATAHAIDDTASKVHAASGAYEDIENNARDQFKAQQMVRSASAHLPSGTQYAFDDSDENDEKPAPPKPNPVSHQVAEGRIEMVER